jgi:hypothetical protein
MTAAAAEAGVPPPWAETPPPPESVSVERAVCQLLLGRVDAAGRTLGLGGGQYTAAADPAVERFVADHSPMGDMVGRCRLTLSNPRYKRLEL